MKESRAARERSWDVWLALLLLLFGVLGFTALWRPELFGLRSGDESLSSFIGEVKRQDGDVRRKPTGSVVWRDLSSSTVKVAAGDTIFTGENGHAQLAIGSKTTAEIDPSSLVVIQKDLVMQGGSLWSRLLDKVTHPAAIIHLAKGSVHLQNVSDRPPIKIEANGKVYSLKVMSGAGDLQVSLKSSGDGDHLEVATEAGTQVQVTSEKEDSSPVNISGRNVASLPLPKLSDGAGELAHIGLDSDGDFAKWKLPSLVVHPTTATTRIFDKIHLDSIPVHLKWDPISSATSYRVKVFHGSQVLVDQPDIKDTSYRFELTTLDSEPLSYQVSAVLKSGDALESDPSPLEIQFVDPIVRAPASARSIARDQKLLITWQRTLLTPRYRVQIASDPEFQHVKLDHETDLNLEPFRSATSGTFYVRVKSVSGTRESPWSKTQRLVVKGGQ